MIRSSIHSINAMTAKIPTVVQRPTMMTETSAIIGTNTMTFFMTLKYNILSKLQHGY